MRTTTVRCDRCSEVIREGRSVLVCEAGLLAQFHDGDVDLCRDCADAFKGWLSETWAESVASPRNETRVEQPMTC